MKAALVAEAGQPPVYGDFREPVAATDDVLVTVSAAALSHVTKARASGRHYSSSAGLPFVAGMDGVGRLDDGRRIYFVLPTPPWGSMAEQTVVNSAQCIALPDALDDVTAAAIAVPGMSSWAALAERAKLVAGETVLINGATGTSGRLAVQIARYLGAKQIIATGRNAATLAALGADRTISLVQEPDALEQAFMQTIAGGVDVVLDYVWGPSAERLLIAAAKAGRDAVPLRFVEIGSMGGENITLPSAVLRSSAIELMGSGLGSIPPARMLHVLDNLFHATVPGGFQIATRAVPLSDVASFWSMDDPATRTVFVTGSYDGGQ